MTVIARMIEDGRTVREIAAFIREAQRQRYAPKPRLRPARPRGSPVRDPNEGRWQRVAHNGWRAFVRIAP